tara:strand:- start:2167 stop:3384 length:1218 start_codon:yes stop_codon:yes gene_type:complete
MRNINGHVRNFLDNPDFGINAHDKMVIIALWESKETQCELFKILQSGMQLGESTHSFNKETLCDTTVAHLDTPPIVDLDCTQSNVELYTGTLHGAFTPKGPAKDKSCDTTVVHLDTPPIVDLDCTHSNVKSYTGTLQSVDTPKGPAKDRPCDTTVVHLGTPPIVGLDCTQSNAESSGTPHVVHTPKSPVEEKVISRESDVSVKLSTDIGAKIKKGKEPKRAKNAYILFSQDNRALVKSELPHDSKNADVIRELGKRWKILASSTDRAAIELVEKYTSLATEEKKNFVLQSEYHAHGVKKHMTTSQYCYGCYNDGLGHSDEGGWFYCNRCWSTWGTNGLSKATSQEPHQRPAEKTTTSVTPHNTDFTYENETSTKKNANVTLCNLAHSEHQTPGQMQDISDTHSVY